MVTFKRFRSIGLAGLFFTVCMLASLAVSAQTGVEATVLTTNVDVQKKKLYVEMNYTPKACGTYQLRFRLEKKVAGSYQRIGTPTEGGYTAITLDSVISNDHGTTKIGSYTLPGPVNLKVLNLDNTAVGGYSLRFALNSIGGFNPANISSSDSLKVCLEVYRIAYRCKFCGVSRSDLLFTDADRDPACPYVGDDLVACSKRVGGAKNWEAHIQDPRDCRVYRVVQMPETRNSDGSVATYKWWFAQNLNYQKDLSFLGGSGGVTDSAHYWCPGPSGTQNNPSYELATSTITNWACEIYGALYPWKTARSLDGTGPRETFTPATSAKTASVVRGVCPPNWTIPNDAQWGIMLNAVEDCLRADSVNNERTPLTPPCNHFTSTATTTIQATGNISTSGGFVTSLGGLGSGGNLYFYNLGQDAGHILKATYTCPPGAATPNCDNDNGGNSNNKFGLYRDATFASTRWGYSATHTGSDLYGFSALPAGFRWFQNATDNRFYGRGQYAIFMTSTQYNSVSPMYRMISHDRSDIRRFYPDATGGAASAFSVRCVR